MISEVSNAMHDIRVEDRIAAVSSARRVTQTGPGRDGFAASLVRETRSAGTAEEAALYGSDARMINKLEQRDREVRQTESAKGEALGDSNFIYQVGPDGKRYAIGTAAHAVKPDGGMAEEASKQRGVDGKELSEGDEALLEKLQARDAKVRNHEAAHVMAAGGQAQGLPTYTYQTGPDGRRYAIGGSVNISVMRTGDEEANVRRANKAYRAAMATGEPSVRDMQTAHKAAAISAQEKQRALESYAWQDQILANQSLGN